MKKKWISTCLLLSLLVFVGACNSKAENKDRATTQAEITETPTNSPLPTACVEVAQNKDEGSVITNETDGYRLTYDAEVLEMKNENSTISFKANEKNKKAQEELNLYLSITTTDTETADALGEQLKSAYGKSVKEKSVTIGSDNTDSVCYTITKVKKLRHQIYIISGDEKGWYIELKCPAKYQKKYNQIFDDILKSLSFEEKK